jgi:hypothetical protein
LKEALHAEIALPKQLKDGFQQYLDSNPPLAKQSILELDLKKPVSIFRNLKVDQLLFVHQISEICEKSFIESLKRIIASLKEKSAQGESITLQVVDELIKSNLVKQEDLDESSSVDSSDGNLQEDSDSEEGFEPEIKVYGFLLGLIEFSAFCRDACQHYQIETEADNSPVIFSFPKQTEEEESINLTEAILDEAEYVFEILNRPLNSFQVVPLNRWSLPFMRHYQIPEEVKRKVEEESKDLSKKIGAQVIKAMQAIEGLISEHGYGENIKPSEDPFVLASQSESLVADLNSEIELLRRQLDILSIGATKQEDFSQLENDYEELYANIEKIVLSIQELELLFNEQTKVASKLYGASKELLDAHREMPLTSLLTSKEQARVEVIKKIIINLKDENYQARLGAMFFNGNDEVGELIDDLRKESASVAKKLKERNVKSKFVLLKNSFHTLCQQYLQINQRITSNKATKVQQNQDESTRNEGKKKPISKSAAFKQGAQQGANEALNFSYLCLKYGVSPLALSITLICSKDEGRYNLAPAFRFMGWLSLPGALFLTVPTLLVGGVASLGALVSTPFWASYRGFQTMSSHQQASTKPSTALEESILVRPQKSL